MENEPTTPYWALAPAEAAERLSVDLEAGLSAAEVRRRLAQHGPNELTAREGPGKLRLLLGQFANLMIGLLAAAAVVSAALGDWQDALLIFAIVLANAVIGFGQELRAEQALAALRKLSQPKARLLRDGRLVEAPAREIVPGDLLELAAGDLVPADGRLVEAVDLQIDEAPLTGESHGTEKQAEPVPPDAGLSERASMAFAGTAVCQGRGRLLVTATGMQTELGKVAALLETAQSGPTPLQARLAALGRRLAAAVVVVCVLVFVAGLARGAAASWSQMLLTSVSLAVAAIPEGLPAVITIALALGSQRMARRKAIVRQLVAVETLGSVNVICSDKTGTLTQNKMTVGDVVPAAAGRSAEQALLRAAALCNNAQWSPETGATGAATETALVQAAADRGLDVAALRQTWPRHREVPFSSVRKRMTTLHRAADGTLLAVTKGGPEIVLAQADALWSGHSREPLTDDRRRALVDLAAELAGRGQRVLGFAQRQLSAAEADLPPERLERGLEFLGLLALVDPLRPEALQAVAQCRSAGIDVVMITGDHQATAAAIARELGFELGPNRVVTGAELDRLGAAELERRAGEIAIYARVSPEHKLRIVRAHQARGSAVAMTGDGVNDAPALEQADIGVAMGITGTDVSKGAANMVLADDNFATIVAAVEEGRIVYDNIRRFVRYLLTSNASEILVLVLAILAGWPLPLVPVQLLWINLVTDGLPALALGFEPAERGVMRRRPRPRGESLFADGMAWGIALLGLLMSVATLSCYAHLLSQPRGELAALAGLTYARTQAFLVLSLSQLFFVLGLRSSERPLWDWRGWTNWRLVAASAAGAALQLAIVYVPWLQGLFRTAPLTPADLVVGVAASTAPFWAVEILRLVRGASAPVDRLEIRD